MIAKLVTVELIKFNLVWGKDNVEYDMLLRRRDRQASDQVKDR